MPRAEFAHVFHDLRALGPVQRRRVVQLRLQVGFGVGRDRPLHLIHRAIARRAADERGQFGFGGVAQHVHQEQPVLGARIARAEHNAGARAAVDVRDAEAAVALDRHVRPGARRRGDIAFFDAERRVLEVAGDLRVRERGRRVQEVRVQRELIGEVWG